MFTKLVEAYVNIGVLGVIAVMYIYRSYIRDVKSDEKTDKMLHFLNSINAKLDGNLNSEQFEKMLVFKFKNISRKLYIEIGEYIYKNNINKRYNIIREELLQFKKDEILKFRHDLEDLGHSKEYIKSIDFLTIQLDLTLNVLLNELEKLVQEHTIEFTKDVIRNVSVECKKFENRLVEFAQDI